MILFYRTADGKCPVQDFLDALPGKVAQKVVWVLRRNLSAGLSESEREKEMSDLKRYIAKRKKTDKEFVEGFEEGYEQFKIGVVLRQARESAGLTQEELAIRLKTQKTAISRIENHAEDIKLSTLDRVAKALGKRLEVNIA
jgi:HTH-type transcriptional regulator/antitoxin HipB